MPVTASSERCSLSVQLGLLQNGNVLQQPIFKYGWKNRTIAEVYGAIKERFLNMSIPKLIDVAQGNSLADLVVKNVRIFHLTDGSFETADVAIANGVIAGVGKDYEGTEVINGTGLTAVPGFIDAHCHVESSMVTPFEFARAVLPHGVTTAFCDPHELANVAGTAAFQYFFQAAAVSPMDLRVRLSSCVPATHLETSGAEVTVADLAEWKKRHPEAGLAEMMNVPGVLFQDPQVLEKMALFDFIDGHCPLLGGKALNAYIAAGVRNCHECCNLTEAQEKLRRGMQVLIREGTAARNLDDLLPLLNVETSPFCSFCTDDRNPLDVQEKGHLDSMVARCIAKGVPPLAAYRAASWSTANAMQLTDRGLVAPGQRADIVLLKDLETCQIATVIAKGRVVNDALFDKSAQPDGASFRNSIKLRAVTAADFPFVHAENAPVIGVIDGSLLTEHLHLPTKSPEIQRVAVLERYGKNGNIALGWVKGFGLKRGAIASSVGHDSHNVCVVGTNPEDMAVAVNALRESQGGFAVAMDGKVADVLPLPLGGLMSDQPMEVVADQLRTLRQALLATGCTLEAPTLQLAFIPLPVIPHLKLTDKGLVDVDKFQLLE